MSKSEVQFPEFESAQVPDAFNQSSQPTDTIPIFGQETLCISRGKCLRRVGKTFEVLYADLPEFEGTQRDKETAESIRSSLAKKINIVDVIYIYESLAADIKLEREFAWAKAIYGSEALKSVIVIVTESDITPPEDVEGKMREIDRLCMANNVPWIEWMNNCETERVAQYQDFVLRAGLECLRPLRIVEHVAEPMVESNPEAEEAPAPPQQVETHILPMTQQPSIHTLSDSEMQKGLDTVEESKQDPVETTAELNTTVPYSPPQTDTVQQAVKRPIQRGSTDCPYKLRKLQEKKAVVVAKTGKKEVCGAEKKQTRSVSKAANSKKQRCTENQTSSGRKRGK